MPKSYVGTSFRVLLCPETIQRLQDNVNVTDILHRIRESELLSEEECSAISSSKENAHNSLRLSNLLNVITAKPSPHSVDKFLQCLRDSDYNHAAKCMEDHLDTLQSCVTDCARTNHLKAGLVPGQPSLFVSRKELEFKIKDQIMAVAQMAQSRVNHGTNWVLIHGMPGNGKSYLAAAALRSPEMWKVCFSDGIYWLDIGKPGKEKLLIKMGSLLHMVDDKLGDSTLKTPSEIELTITQLAKAVAHQHPNSVLILDDVWDTEVIKAFDKVSFKCAVVTSRRTDIVDAVKGKVIKISVDNGFTQEESQQYFAHVMDCPVTLLPNQAVTIHQTSHGSPMVMALIGGMLREHREKPPWDYYVRKLEESPRSVLSMTSNRNDYPHESIDEAIRLSVESLKDDLREKFFDFAVFDDDVPVPTAVFRTLWGFQENETTDDQMAYFVNSSICTKEFCSFRDTYLYRFHDLILQYARGFIPFRGSSAMTQEKVRAIREGLLVDKHRRLYNKYYVTCSGKFDQLPNDYYVHSFIGYHMSLGKLLSDMEPLYEDRKFLDRRIEFAGPEVVLVDIILLKKQHPFLKELLCTIEREVRDKFALRSPPVRANRRSFMEDHISNLNRRASESDVDSIPGADLQEGGRRSAVGSPESRPNSVLSIALKEVHSEPANLSSENAARADYSEEEPSSRTVPVLRTKHANNQATHPNPNITGVSQKLSMLSLRNDNFDRDEEQ